MSTRYRDPVARRKACILCRGSLVLVTAVVVFLAYPALCVAVMELLPCARFQGLGNRWDINLSVACDNSSSHTTWRWFVGVPASVAITAFPLLAMWLALRRVRSTLHTTETRVVYGTWAVLWLSRHTALHCGCVCARAHVCACVACSYALHHLLCERAPPGFMYSGHDPRVWFWDIAAAGTKCVLAAAIVLLAPFGAVFQVPQHCCELA